MEQDRLKKEQEIIVGMAARVHGSTGFAGIPEGIITIDRIADEPSTDWDADQWADDPEYKAELKQGKWVKVKYSDPDQEAIWFPASLLFNHITTY